MPIKRFASNIFNMLPDRVNMFGRYMTGVGGEGLELDRSTEKALIAATEVQPSVTRVLSPVERAGLPEGMPASFQIPAYGPGIPTSGPVTNPYYNEANKDATQTLGRFNAEVTPDTVRVMDTYDMVNNVEDPDLVSGKFQPKKAMNNLIAAFDHSKIFDQNSGDLIEPKFKQNEGYNTQSKMQDDSPALSKATSLARSLMYLAPWKPKAYDVNYTIQR
jgi:hypothetical protein